MGYYVFSPASALPSPITMYASYTDYFLSLLPVLLDTRLINFVFSCRYHIEQCTDFYNITAEELAVAVAQTNEYYGGYNIRSSRIVFPNGSIDPWHALGITQDITPDLPAVFIKGEQQ